jgi:NTP pyrophosphatase (non-canonical NTP hydrolase)
MADATTSVAALKAGICQFAEARGWGPYHSPKNLTMALASEVGELCQLFRWMTAEESWQACDDPDRRTAIADELADIANIIMLLSEHTGIDLSEAVAAKMVKNAIKYPAPEPGTGSAGA